MKIIVLFKMMLKYILYMEYIADVEALNNNPPIKYTQPPV